MIKKREVKLGLYVHCQSRVCGRNVHQLIFMCTSLSMSRVYPLTFMCTYVSMYVHCDSLRVYQLCLHCQTHMCTYVCVKCFFSTYISFMYTKAVHPCTYTRQSSLHVHPTLTRNEASQRQQSIEDHLSPVNPFQPHKTKNQIPYFTFIHLALKMRLFLRNNCPFLIQAYSLSEKLHNKYNNLSSSSQASVYNFYTHITHHHNTHTHTHTILSIPHSFHSLYKVSKFCILSFGIVNISVCIFKRRENECLVGSHTFEVTPKNLFWEVVCEAQREAVVEGLPGRYGSSSERE